MADIPFGGYILCDSRKFIDASSEMQMPLPYYCSDVPLTAPVPGTCWDHQYDLLRVTQEEGSWGVSPWRQAEDRTPWLRHLFTPGLPHPVNSP